MQEPSRAMRHDNDGEVAAGVATSHDDDHQEHIHGSTIRGCRADADAGEEEEDEEQPSAMDDARVEFPSDDEDIDGDGVRVSFASAVGDRLLEEDEEQAELDMEAAEEEEDTSRYDYGMWMEADEPVSIQERRRRLLQGMGLNSSRDLLRSRNARAATATATATARLPPDIPRSAPPRRHHQHHPSAAAAAAMDNDAATKTMVAAAPPAIATRQPDAAAMITRSRSDSRLAVRSGGARKPPPSFRRVHSLPHSLRCPLPAAAAKDTGTGKSTAERQVNGGKELVMKGQRSAPLSVKELERFIGYTPVVKQLMLRSQSQPVAAAAKGGGGETTKTPEKKRTRWLKNIKLVASAAGLRNDKDNKESDGRSSATTMSKSASVSSSSSSTTERLKVHHYGKSSKELTGVYMRQEVQAHDGSIWTIKFSPDGRFLASAGEDRVVRVWEVAVDADASSSVAAQDASASVPSQPTPGLAAQLSRRMRRGRSGKGDVLPDHVVVPESVFKLADHPAAAFDGHQDDVLDLSWSKSQKLLSSSMDKTVRLWDVDTKTCLKMFPHNDYVTCVQFNPVDDGYFITGSLDCKVRIWSVPDRHVVDWSDVSDMVTAVCYTPDGQAAIIGTHKGSCRFYKTTDCKLNQEAQIDMSISKKRRSQAKKITGFQFAPGNPSEILVTSADSQIRVFNGITVLQKFKGFKNTSSQISASYTADGRHVVCASEDSNVYVWRRVPTSAASGSGGDGIGIGVRAKTWLTSRSYEYFFCRDVSVAVPWPGSLLSPELRKKKQGEDSSGVPRRHKSGPMGYPGAAQQMQQQPEELYRRESSASARWHGGAEGGNAWGMVVVTASRGGEIRVYQNFGMPLGNLFH